MRLILKLAEDIDEYREKQKTNLQRIESIRSISITVNSKIKNIYVRNVTSITC